MTLQETIIAQLGVKPSINPKEEIRKSVDFLKAYMIKHPFLKTYVLGISGGQDSTLAGRLAQLAVEELRAETEKDYQLSPFVYHTEFKQMKTMPTCPSFYQARCKSYD